MSSSKFTASVQYNDFKGESAADTADLEDASKWLEENGHLTDGEILVGIELFAGENHGEHQDPVYINFFLATSGDFDTVREMIDSNKEAVNVKKVSVEMPISDFLGLFKRFSIVLSRDGLLENCTLSYDD